MNVVSGNSRISKLIRWHPLPNTNCFALVTEFVPGDDIVKHVYGQPEKVKKFISDIIKAIQWCHKKGVIYRDLKLENVMWNNAKQRAVLIDFDVTTFFRPKTGHQVVVGSDGFIAPEIVAIDAKRKEIREHIRTRSKIVQNVQNHGNNKRIKGRHGKTRWTPKKEKFQEKTRWTPKKGKYLHEKKLRKELSSMSYGLEVDVYSIGILFGAVLLEEEEEEVLNYCDDNEDDYGNYLRQSIHSRMILENGDHYTIAHSLLSQLIKKDPKKRITLQQALEHPYFTGTPDDHAKLIQHELREAQKQRLKEQQEAKTKKKNRPKKILCCSCNRFLSKSYFSKGQRKKQKGKKKRCRNCVKKIHRKAQKVNGK